MVALFSGGVIQNVQQVPTSTGMYTMLLHVHAFCKSHFENSIPSCLHFFFQQIFFCCCCDAESVQSASEGESPPQKAIGQSASMIRKGKVKFD